MIRSLVNIGYNQEDNHKIDIAHPLLRFPLEVKTHTSVASESYSKLRWNEVVGSHNNVHNQGLITLDTPLIGTISNILIHLTLALWFSSYSQSPI